MANSLAVCKPLPEGRGKGWGSLRMGLRRSLNMSFTDFLKTITFINVSNINIFKFVKLMLIRVTKEFSFEMAHALEGHDGACRQIHGHSYRLWVTVKGEPLEGESPKQGMVVDFGELKRIVQGGIVGRYDHALVVRRTPGNADLTADLAQHYDNIVTVDWQPTSENLVASFVETIHPLLPAGVALCSVRLSETATSYAEWLAEDNE